MLLVVDMNELGLDRWLSHGMARQSCTMLALKYLLTLHRSDCTSLEKSNFDVKLTL